VRELAFVRHESGCLVSIPVRAPSRVLVSSSPGAHRVDVRSFGIAGLLHDLGKVKIPLDVLNKVGPYTDRERKVMQQHPVEGARLLLARQKELDLAAVVAYEHHILLNGQGYPILRYPRSCHLASQIVHVCDVYDALCTDRPYRAAWESTAALAYMEDRAESEFEADTLRVFVEMMRHANRQYVAMEQPAA
jgi:HD-GYP domain-containing protein (c-di-GMP phosphodiesterase class II)